MSDDQTPLLGVRPAPYFDLVKDNLAGAINIAFEDGMGWQLAFSIAVVKWGYAPNSWPTVLLTGTGDMLGVFTSYLLFNLSKKYFFPNLTYKKIIAETCHYSLASFFSGCAWVFTEYRLINWGAPFAPTALGTGFACGVIFLLMVQLFRPPFHRVFKNEIKPHSRAAFFDDLKLAFGIFGGNAGFTATDYTHFKNPMTYFFRTNSDDYINACLKAGGTASLFAFAMRLFSDIAIDRLYCYLSQPRQTP